MKMCVESDAKLYRKFRTISDVNHIPNNSKIKFFKRKDYYY